MCMMTHKKKIEDKKIKGRGNIESLTLRTCMYCNVVLAWFLKKLRCCLFEKSVLFFTNYSNLWMFMTLLHKKTALVDSHKNKVVFDH